ncbi:MAG: PaaI family thioesterase [Syntrophomonadaceae bacterium]|jgi:uncharacterized protein (TIGR00369 family)
MKKFNPLFKKELINMLNSAPFFTNLSIVIEDIDVGYCVATIDVKEKHLSPYGAVQGGVYSSIIDAVSYFAPYAELPEDVGLITIDVNVNNVGTIRNGKLIARGERIKAGRSICLSQATVTDEYGKILAYGSSKLLVTRGLQIISQMAGYPANMPPKFLNDG